ncbi:MAG TPA: hypothetical protein VFO76_13355, partial [Candidatus Kapabacteria bacterium]|nr:hypothetical protein [Candidatus Kapabacteria bacterium]
VISVIIPGSYSTAPTLVKPVININSPLYSGTGLSSDQFTVSATLFGGDDLCPASLSCQNQGNTLYRNCIIDQCTFTDFSIFASNPQNDWTVTGSTFYKPFSKAIELQWGIADINSHPYGAISITGNTINCIPSLNNQLFSGIHVEGFSKPRSNSSNPFDKILIEGNEIEAAPNSTSTAESSVSGIKLINTSAKVSGNAVHGGRNPFYNNTVGNGFQYGIYNEGAPDGTTPSNSLLCNNTIISCAAPSSTGAGINTQRWNGVAQLNDVSGSNIGHQSNVNDDGRILWSRYHSNSLCGLKLAAASSHMDLSGYHISASSTDLPALNTIDGNNLTHSTTSGQIVLTGNQFFWLGTDNTTSITNFGNNNIISLESDDILDPLIYNPTGTPTTGINKNFWGHDDGTSINSWTLKSTPELIVGINYANGSFQNGSSYALGTVGCTDGLEEHNDNQIIRPKDAAFDEGNISVADCAHLYNVGKDYSGSSKPINLRKGYDTLRSFIESCAAIPNSADGKPSWGAFISLDKCVNEMDTANIRWLEYREWLKKVLYLSDDSMYYCSDVNSLFTTFNYLVPSKGWDYNSIIAVIDYLLTSNRCPDQTAYFLEGRQYDRDRQVQFWRDTVKDSIATPLDTSAISIDSIGLSILKGPQFGAVKNHPFQSIALSELRASKNPFTDETTLETTISDAMMLRLEVFDVLGKQVYSENEFFSSGDVRWKLDGKLLPKGSLYARVSTIGGNVRTVKLVRE